MLLLSDFYAFYGSCACPTFACSYLIDSGFLCVGWLAGGSPAATHFSLLRQRKVSKRKATRLSGSLRCATGNLRCPGKTGVRANSLHCVTLKQRAALIPFFPVITGPARTGGEGAIRNPIPCSPTPSVCAEERSFKRIRAARCLSRRRVCADPA